MCGTRRDAWEELVTQFEALGALPFLAPLLPTHNPQVHPSSPIPCLDWGGLVQLEPECYEMVLIAFLDRDVSGFRRLIRQWCVFLQFSASCFVDAVLFLLLFSFILVRAKREGISRSLVAQNGITWF